MALVKRTHRDMLEDVKRGKKAIGSGISSPDHSIIEIMALAGYDYVLISMEHGTLDWSDVREMLRTAEAAGLATKVKVPHFDDKFAINKAIDMGAQCIKLVGIESVEDAKKAVDLCKYPPLGHRDNCPWVRGNDYGVNGADSYTKVNEGITLSVSIESLGAIRDMEEIIALPGIDAYSVGCFDLSMLLGVPMQTYHPKVQEVVHKMAALCDKYGKCCTAHIRSAEDLKNFEQYKNIYWYVEMPLRSLYVALNNKHNEIMGTGKVEHTKY